jgi:hypothetical protein
MKTKHATRKYWTDTAKAGSALAAIGLLAAAMPSLGQGNAPTNPAPVSAAVGGSSAATQPEKLTAVLPSGVEIELVALSFYPDENQPWWRPDGTPLSEPPIDGSFFDISSSTAPKLELVFRLGKKAAEPGYESRMTLADGSGLLWTGRRRRNGVESSELLVVATRLPADSAGMSMDLLVGAGPWENVATTDGLQPQGPLGAAIVAPNFSDPTTQIRAFFATSRQARIVGIDKYGISNIASPTGIRKTGKDADQDFLFSRTPPSQFKSFTLQTRPYELIHLKDVSTASGQRTHPQLIAGPESKGN